MPPGHYWLQWDAVYIGGLRGTSEGGKRVEMFSVWMYYMYDVCLCLYNQVCETESRMKRETTGNFFDFL